MNEVKIKGQRKIRSAMKFVKKEVAERGIEAYLHAVSGLNHHAKVTFTVNGKEYVA